MNTQTKNTSAFTIVELLIVIVVIAILASISVVAYNGIQDRANESKLKSDLSALDKAVSMARVNRSVSLRYITGSASSGASYWGKPTGTDLAALPRSDACWTAYASALDAIYQASGTDVRNLVDPWGRPYYIDENQDEPDGTCRGDNYGIYARPFTTGQTMSKRYDTKSC